MIAYLCSCACRFQQPLRYQALRELALSVVVAKYAPCPSPAIPIQQPLQRGHIIWVAVSLESAPEARVQPQPKAHFHRAASAWRQRQQELQRPYEMRTFRLQSLSLAQRLAHQPDLAVFQVTQAAVNDARRPARRAAGKIVLLHQQSPPARLRTLPRNGDTIDTAAHHGYVKALAVQRTPLSDSVLHLCCLDALVQAPHCEPSASR